MPPFPHAARNERGGTSDFWDDYMRHHWELVDQKALLNDGMSVSFGGGEATKPPHGLRFMDDAHAAGDLIVAGEVIKA